MFIKDVDGTHHNVRYVVNLYVTGAASDWRVALTKASEAGGGSVYLTGSLSTQAAAEAALEPLVAALGGLDVP